MAITSAEIIKQIKDIKRTYTKKEQRAELLKRNPKFLNELKELNARIKEKCGGLDIKTITSPGAFYKYPELTEDALIDNDLGGAVHPFIYFHNKFMEFCQRWNLYLDWDGDINNLSISIFETPIVVFDHWAAGVSRINFSRIIRGFPSSFYLGLWLDAWTTLNDIKQIWPKIEKLQKRIFDYKAEKKSNTFGRDLAWHDLKKIYGLSYGKIAKAWIEHCPEDIDSIVIKAFKKKNTKILKEKLRGCTSILDEYISLLRMIGAGELGEDVRAEYKAEKELYSTGVTESGKRFTPRFIDAIKQGIKRIEFYIKQTDPKEKYISLPPYEQRLPWLKELDEIEYNDICQAMMRGEIVLPSPDESAENIFDEEE